MTKSRLNYARYVKDPSIRATKLGPAWMPHTSRHFYAVALLLSTEIVHFVKGKLHFSKVPNTHA